MSAEYVMLTTLSHFKLKYAIPREEFEALGFSEPLDREQVTKLLTSGGIKEFSQTHLGEVLQDASVYTEEDTLKIFDIDNNYLSSWTEEQKRDWISKWEA